MWYDALLGRRLRSEFKARSQRAEQRRGEPPCRRMRLEPLEDRRMLGLGNLLQPPDVPSAHPQPYSAFGYAVAADGDLTVVGTPYADVGGLANVGRAYVFDTLTGDLLHTLENPTPVGNEDHIPDFFYSGGFGTSVAVSGSTVVVGAPGDNAAYVFDLTNLGAGPVTLANPAPGFGRSVAISGSTVVVAAPDYRGRVVYVFDLTGTAPETPTYKLDNPTPWADGYFGRSVAVSGSTVVVAAAWSGSAAYVFDLTGTAPETPTYSLADPMWDNHFSTPLYFVAVSGSTVVVGTGDGFGAYVYDLSGTTPETPTYQLMTDYVSVNPVAVSGSTVAVGKPFWGPEAYVFDLTGTTPETPTYTLDNPSPAGEDWFGLSVAVSGSSVVVGAFAKDVGAYDAGAAYVFDALTGDLLHTLKNPTPTGGDIFGSSVAVSGSTVVVGAYQQDVEGTTDAGAVYVFDLTGTAPRTPTYKLDNPTPVAEDWFGYSVAVSGSTLVVGAPYHDQTVGTNVYPDSGAAYVFDALTGDLLHTLKNPTPQASATFGSSVAVSGSTVVVGAYQQDVDGTTDAGAVYVFDVTGTTPTHALDNPTPQAGATFGNSVAISGSTVVVGAYQQDIDGTTDAGAAYVFDLTVTAPETPTYKLDNPTPQAGATFGSSVAVSGSTVVVGAYQQDIDGTTDAGAAYVFDLTGTAPETPTYKLDNPTPDANGYFGWSVAVSGSTVVVGAYQQDIDGTKDAGAVYLFDVATPGDPLLLHMLEYPTPVAEDWFGYSVAVSGSAALVGAPRRDSTTTDRGAAYLFDTTPDTRVSLTGNDLVILDHAPGGKDDLLTLSLDIVPEPDELVIRDRSAVLGTGIPGANADGTHTFRLPVTAFSGQILVDTLEGDDALTVDFSGGDPLAPGGLVYDGGANGPVGDRLEVIGTSSLSAAYRPDATTTGNGSVEVRDSGTSRYITFTGLEAVGVSNMQAAGLITPHGADNLTVAGAATGDLLGTLDKLTPVADERFGQSVAVSGSTVVVGAPYYDQTVGTNVYPDSGAAYVFDALTGHLVRMLENPRPGADGRFGQSVAVSGSTVVVGAPYYDQTVGTNVYPDSGAAYVFDVTTGDLVQTLENPTAANEDYFGSSVAVWGNIVVVGAPYHDQAVDTSVYVDAGAAYVFDAYTGSHLLTLVRPTPQHDATLGTSVAVSGDHIVVGAQEDNTGSAWDCGAAYVFDAATGVHVSTLLKPTPAAYDFFGCSVAVSGSTVVVGAYRDDTGPAETGAAYVFDLANLGAGPVTLADPTPAAYDFFGWSVAVSGSTVVVGTPLKNVGADNSGVAYVFNLDALAADPVTLANPTRQAGATFGNSVAVSGSTVVVGAYQQDVDGTTDAGAAHLFDAARRPTITGTSGGLALESLTLSDVTELVLALDAEPSAISNHDALLLAGDDVARGLESITVHLGAGADDVEVAGVVDLGSSGQFRATGEMVNLKLSGGSITAERLQVPVGTQVSGTGTVAAALAGVDRIEATGPLELGTGGLGGFSFDGTLVVGGFTVTLGAADFARLGVLTTIDGGVLEAPGGVGLGLGCTLQGTGTVAGSVAAQVGSTILATGDLVLGDANAYDGFVSDGRLHVNAHNVTIHDRNEGVLGSLTQIGDDTGPGMLNAPNGLLLENGKTLYGYGVVNNAFENQGHVVGPLEPDELELTGDVTGSGSFDGNIRFSGTYSPGNSPAEIPFGGNVAFAPSATLYIEIGGASPGTQFDRLSVSGQAQLGGDLVVSLIDDYVPGAGDAFEIVGTGDGLLGTFATESLPALPPDHVWKVHYSPDAMRLEVELPSTTHMQAVLRAADAGLPADPNGEAETLPESLQWVDEWDSFWIEIWGRTPDTTGYGIGSFSVDLLYNTELFSATTIEYGPAFTEDRTGAIDDAAGRVDQIAARTTQTDVGDDQNVLLARVFFEPMSCDTGCPHNADGQYVTPVEDLGLAFEEAGVELVGVGQSTVQLGASPETDSWPVIYDVDDDGRIGFGDLAYFAEAFQQSVGDPGADFAWACDFDHSLKVDFGDLAFFAENFQRVPGSPIVYPVNFPDDWQAGTQQAAAVRAPAAAEGLQAPDPAFLSACCMWDIDTLEAASTDSSDAKQAIETIDFLIAHGYW